MKHWPNVITALRIAASIGLLFCNVADIVFVVCCAVQLLPVLEIPTWLWIWSVRFFRGLDFCTPSSLEHYPCFDHYYEESLTY